ncbi:MAG TPA: hypothetical protein VEH29_18080 [Acidimicrobiales bacterium]|nr:hypothetical protein [Acidimicrobiales bacterium]
MRREPPELLLAVVGASAPTAVVCEPTSAAVVLGSTQDESEIDPDRCARAGLDVLRRRSGGGAVVVRPGAQLWVDVFVPRHDPRFVEDVLASFAFLGEAWRAALATSLDADPSSLAVVEGGAIVKTPWSRTLCFAGLGAGEVTFHGRKIVGISQRRERAGAWFHSMAMLEFDPFELPGLLRRAESDRLAAARLLESTAAAVPGGRNAGPPLRSALLHALG